MDCISQVKELCEKVNLVELAGESVSLSRRGDYWEGPCPFEGTGTDRFSVNEKKQRWFCRWCEGISGGGVVSYLMKLKGIKAKEAVLLLQERTGFKFEITGKMFERDGGAGRRKVEQRVPAPEYIEAAMLAASKCATDLWATEEGRKNGLGYLYGRGLKDETIRKFGLGYSNRCSMFGLKMYEGIVIPKIGSSGVWILKIRTLDGGKLRYVTAGFSDVEQLHALQGGVNVAFGEWRTKKNLFLTEGEFDAMLLWQECAGEVGVLTMGGCAEKFDSSAKMAIAAAPGRVFLAYDGDSAGGEAVAKLMGEFPRLERAFLPETVKDLTDYWRAGGNLQDWAQSLLEKAPELHELTQKVLEWIRFSGWVRVRDKDGTVNFLVRNEWLSCFKALGRIVWETAVNDRAVSQVLHNLGARSVVA